MSAIHSDMILFDSYSFYATLKVSVLARIQFHEFEIKASTLNCVHIVLRNRMYNPEYMYTQNTPYIIFLKKMLLRGHLWK